MILRVHPLKQEFTLIHPCTFIIKIEFFKKFFDLNLIKNSNIHLFQVQLIYWASRH